MADAGTPMQFVRPTPLGPVSSQAVHSSSAAVSSSSSTGGVLRKARSFSLTADGCFESDPLVEGDPPGFQRMHKVDIEDCSFIFRAPPAGFDQR
jgi:hypothetical protein